MLSSALSEQPSGSVSRALLLRREGDVSAKSRGPVLLVDLAIIPAGPSAHSFWLIAAPFIFPGGDTEAQNDRSGRS